MCLYQCKQWRILAAVRFLPRGIFNGQIFALHQIFLRTLFLNLSSLETRICSSIRINFPSSSRRGKSYETIKSSAISFFKLKHGMGYVPWRLLVIVENRLLIQLAEGLRRDHNTQKIVSYIPFSWKWSVHKDLRLQILVRINASLPFISS